MKTHEIPETVQYAIESKPFLVSCGIKAYRLSC